MASPVEFKGMNGILGKPLGTDGLQCSPLPVFVNGVNVVSCWELSEKDLIEISKTKRIYVSVWSGQTQPPIAIGNEDTIRYLISDNGVWKR